MTERSVISLISILQKYGLTVDTLEDMVYFCERKYTGSVSLHIIDGTISVLEPHGKRKTAAEVEPCLTKA
jgi:hypothetical protein